MKELSDLRDLTEEEYWREYKAAQQRCADKDIRCKCCDQLVMLCHHWQRLRLTICPSPSERKFLDAEIKVISTKRK